MAMCPFAEPQILRYAQDDQAPAMLGYRGGPDTVVLHTNGGGAELFGWFNRPGNTICSHFQIFNDGRIVQYVDTRWQAPAQWDANGFGISVETEDDGDPDTPWTAEQVAAIKRLILWAGVPHRVAPESGGGVGYHMQYESWNQSAHGCPGNVRVRQLLDDIIPHLTDDPPAPPEPTLGEWMADNAAQVRQIIAETMNGDATRESRTKTADNVASTIGDCLDRYRRGDKSNVGRYNVGARVHTAIEQAAGTAPTLDQISSRLLADLAANTPAARAVRRAFEADGINMFGDQYDLEVKALAEGKPETLRRWIAAHRLAAQPLAEKLDELTARVDALAKGQTANV